MLTEPQPLNYAPQTFNFPSATLPLPLPITIDALAYISEVYDSVFAPQVSGSTPLLKNIRTILFKKLLTFFIKPLFSPNLILFLVV